jgi:hypothetical protein
VEKLCFVPSFLAIDTSSVLGLPAPGFSHNIARIHGDPTFSYQANFQA